MKKVCAVVFLTFFLSGCSLLQPQKESTEAIPTEASPLPESEYISAEDTTHNFFITQQNFGIDKIFVTEGEDLILSVRNQHSEPINLTVSELRVQSETIEPGGIARVEIPTTRPGEYELFSSLGSQREDGFTSTIIIESLE